LAAGVPIMGRAMRLPHLLGSLVFLLPAACTGPQADPKSTDAWERYLGVVEVLGPRRDAEAMAERVRLLDDPHYLVVVGVLETFEADGDPAFLQHAVTGLRHTHPMVRQYACRLIGSLRRPEGTPILSGVLRQDADPGVRRAAVKALARYGADPVVYEALVEGVGDKDPSVVLTAHEELESLSGVKGLPRRPEAWRKAVLK
jgi:HEAT repeat protein